MPSEVKSMIWRGDHLLLLEQRRLPHTIEMVDCRTYQDVAASIRDMVVRGAPAIGAAAAYGIVLAARESADMGLDLPVALESIFRASDTLAATRPTAVNLFWALNRMTATARAAMESGTVPNARELAIVLESEAETIFREDLRINMRIGEHGSAVMPKEGGVLTHCNAGALATAGYGTALGVIRAAYAKGARFTVFADETRPYMQGTRLTSWELLQEGIPVTLIADNMAGHCMQQGLIHAVVVGADRITANGDTANKIGTYSVAILARYHNIPFYVAAPGSTVDMSLASGDLIPIEQRNPEEVTHWKGERIAPEGVDVLNPSFDVTPSRLISGIITEAGIVRPPFDLNLPLVMGV